MSAGAFGAQLLPVFPSIGRCALAAVLGVAAWLWLAAVITRLPEPDAPRLWLQGAALLAASWWLLLASPWCARLYQMVAQRLPGMVRMLWQGAMWHGLLSMAVPGALLSWGLPAEVAGTDLLAVLWLGSALGLLVVSMPMVIPLLPLALVAWGLCVLSDPVACGLLGSAVWLLSAWLWHWQLKMPRDVLLAPAGLLLGAASAQWWPAVQSRYLASACCLRRQAPPQKAAPDAELALLAACLGPACQTLRQQFGRRGQCLSYGLFACVAWALIIASCFVRDGRGGVLLAVLLATLIPLVMQSPAKRLRAMQQRPRGELLALTLVPGMPNPTDLPRVLMQQILRCLGERVLILALVLPAAAALTYPLRWEWWLWWAVLALTGLAQGLASAWMAWQGLGAHWSWRAAMALGLLLAMANNVHLLTSARPQPLLWLMAWLAWLCVALLVFVWLNRQQHVQLGFWRPA